MKKIVLILLLISTSILMLSCSSKEKEQEILIFGTATIFPPFAYSDPADSQKVLGFDIALAREIAKTHNNILEVKLMNFAELIPALQNGEIDIAICGMTITDERKQLINFSLPYYEASQVALVCQEDMPLFEKIRTKEQLGENKKIASLLGSTGAIAAKSIAATHPVLEFNSWKEAIDELLQKNVDIVILDKGLAKIFTSEHDELTVLNIAFEIENYGVAVGKENRELLASVNETIARLINSGEYIQLIENNINAYFNQ